MLHNHPSKVILEKCNKIDEVCSLRDVIDLLNDCIKYDLFPPELKSRIHNITEVVLETGDLDYIYELFFNSRVNLYLESEECKKKANNMKNILMRKLFLAILPKS